MASQFQVEDPITPLSELESLIELLIKFELVASSNVHPTIDGVMSFLYQQQCKLLA